MTEAEEVALLIAPLLERGREALRAYINKLPESERPLGGADSIGPSLDVISYADFCENVALVFRYVITKQSFSTHVLCEDGHICALFEKHAKSTGW